MKKFLLRLLILGSLFFLVDKLAYFILDKTKSLQANKKLEKIVNGHLNHQLLILGSSRGIANVDAGLVEKQTGISTYNISFRGADIVFQEFILNTYLEFNQPPNTIVLIIDNPYTFEEGGSLSYRYDRMYPLAGNNYINNELIEKGEHSFASKFLYLMRLHSNQFRFSPIPTTNGWEIDSYGTQFMLGQSLNFDNYKIQRKLNHDRLESQEKINSFKNILRISRENSIHLHIVFPPNFYKFNNLFKRRIMELTGESVSFFVYDIKDEMYKDKNMYFDPSHLNSEGARYFTKDLNDYLLAVLKTPEF